MKSHQTPCASRRSQTWKSEICTRLRALLDNYPMKSHQTPCASRKYCLELLEDSGLTGCKPVSTLIDPAIRLHHDDGPDQRQLTNSVTNEIE
ncbi:hypothetical protein TSUD_248540 [Trifolium subterraneum]|uniref:Uncharacterized protein n=1 Tax=Trifolium subterraneum TaxID=3900 RepID=A0A2Z6M7K7_TRISU|nr:hypothetical protein TSUD_248540 [Trifolium subterraneum]